MTPDASDTASFDECLELLHLGGRSLPHAVLMMIPEAWENHESMSDQRRDFYSFHSTLMEPWDGPASIAFTDGTVIGAVLDRNGLRPSRYWVTDDGLVVMASEVGVLDIAPETVVTKGRLQPGRMFLVDTEQGRIVADEELKAELAERGAVRPVARGRAAAPRRPARPHAAHPAARLRGQAPADLRLHQEELKIILAPMARLGAEPIGSMGTDTPIAVLSERSRLLFDYFTQLFAQVTNPPLDAIREELVTSMAGTIGPEATCWTPGPESCRHVVLPRRSSPTRSSPRSSTSTRTASTPASRPSPSTGSTPSRRGPTGCAVPSTRSAPRSAPRSRTARRSSCSPTATPTPSWRRSRRCC
jgi:glutamate synthase (NADPH) large chain